MQENRFNLIDEPWIPITDTGKVSLKQVFSDPQLRALGGNAVQKIALMKLLQAICQAAVTPKDDQQWLALGPEQLCEAVLAYLARWHDRFWLYGERPFLQMPAIARAEKKPYGAVLPEISTGNTTVLTHGQVERSLDDADRALLLIVQMGMALGGKKTDNRVVLSPEYQGKTNDKGKPSTGKAGSSLAFMGLLHNFYQGETLGETLWFNLFTQHDISGLTQYPQGMGTAPWEVMPEGELCPVAQDLKQSLMGRLIPVGRFCLLADDGLHYSEGISHGSYKEGYYDPSVVVNKKGKEPKVQWVNPERRPWRELPALLSFLNAQGLDWECEQLRLGMSRIVQTKRLFAIWSGGIRVSSNAGEQYVSGADDIVESVVWLTPESQGKAWFAHFKTEMLELDVLAKRLYGCVNAYFRTLTVDGDAFAKQATALFWQLCERQAQNLVNNCHIAQAREQLRRQFAAYLYQSFNSSCPRSTARQIDAWAKSRPGIGSYLDTVVSTKESA